MPKPEKDSVAKAISSSLPADHAQRTLNWKRSGLLAALGALMDHFELAQMRSITSYQLPGSFCRIAHTVGLGTTMA